MTTRNKKTLYISPAGSRTSPRQLHHCYWYSLLKWHRSHNGQPCFNCIDKFIIKKTKKSNITLFERQIQWIIYIKFSQCKVKHVVSCSLLDPPFEFIWTLCMLATLEICLKKKLSVKLHDSIEGMEIYSSQPSYNGGEFRYLSPSCFIGLHTTASLNTVTACGFIQRIRVKAP